MWIGVCLILFGCFTITGMDNLVNDVVENQKKRRKSGEGSVSMHIKKCRAEGKEYVNKNLQTMGVKKSPKAEVTTITFYYYTSYKLNVMYVNSNIGRY